MNVQEAIDDYMRTHPFTSVLDLEFLRCDGSVNVRRKIGHRPVLIDIDKEPTAESALQRILAHPAVY